MRTDLTRRAKHPPYAKIPSILPQKYIPLYRNSDLRHTPAIPTPGEGRSYVVTNVGWGAVDAAAPARMWEQGGQRIEPNPVSSPQAVSYERRLCVRLNRVVLAVVATAKLLRRCIAPTGRDASAGREVTVTTQNSSPGRARHTPSTHRAGKAECSASPVCCCAVSLRYTFAQRTAGARRHPVFPAPSSRRRRRKRAKLGRLVPREC